MKVRMRSGVLLWLIAGTLGAGACRTFVAAAEHDARAPYFFTNIVQFRNLSAEQFLAGCAFKLSAVVTLVDTNRRLVVLQDASDALALHVAAENHQLAVGEMVSVAASNCYPAEAKFPDYPHWPSGWDVRRKFEVPINVGRYQLTRMRGWLQPPVTGHYTFWIASDNSSELWLSLEADPSRAKRIAHVPRYGWSNPREWSKFASQRSESIWLNAGQSYYIEALQEQTGGADHLAVAWQGPTVRQSVITASHLIPWNPGPYAESAVTNGILREYWTNFTAGDVSGLRRPRPYESALRLDRLHVLRRERGKLPQPTRVSFASQWMSTNNYRWVEAVGVVTFVGASGDDAFLELADSKAQVQLRTAPDQRALAQLTRNVPVRVHGVCEGIFDESGGRVPGWIWVAATNGISVIETAKRDAPRMSATHALTNANRPAQPLSGFYGMHGVVTFSERVFGKDCLFVQEGSAAVFVSLKDCQPRNQLQVGQWVDLGGTLEAGKSLPTMAPMVIKENGWRSMPAPVMERIHFPIPDHRDGRWTEFEGVVRSVQTNGTLSVMGANGSVSVWLGGSAGVGSREPGSYVDAKLRLRGVLSLSAFDHPVLLVPSRSFVEVAVAAPANPFAIPARVIADLAHEIGDPSSLHRVRLIGEVTLRDADSFFLQDQTGGARVKAFGKLEINVGDSVEVIGFPSAGEARMLADVLISKAAGNQRVEAVKLDLTDTLPVRQNGILIRVEADLLAQRRVGHSQILELRERQRIFTATLPASHGSLAAIMRGSRLEIAGVCDSESSALPSGMTAEEKAALGSLNIWLRTPGDVKVLRGPPWWTWRRTAALIGALLAVLSGTLLWVHLLRRRLERQKAAQLAASRHILKRLEDERRRIAANLHDSLGQILLAIKNQTLLTMQRTPDETVLRERLSEISGATSQALEEVRQITHGLRPYQLDRLGLTQAIRATVGRASANGAILFASRVEDVDGVFDKDSEIHVYRILQEAINNVLKHSGATEAAVVIKKRKNDHLINSVSISVRDNGCGFDAADTRASQSNVLGYGLSGITERARILGGHLTIDSQPARGTSLTVEIPVHHHVPLEGRVTTSPLP
jgi:signal transduction histidine kinase